MLNGNYYPPPSPFLSFFFAIETFEGGDGTVGTVRDIRSFKKDMSHRNAVAVTWPSGKSYVYRVGYNGKMDLVCKEVARGFEYYREHLPVLGKTLFKKKNYVKSIHLVVGFILHIACNPK